MDERLKNIADHFDSLQIGLDEPFRFHCTMCGKCCIHREDILLTPRDIYNMSKELGITPVELLQTYCETYIGGDSRMPIIRLKPRGSVRRCPLLKDRKCMVHKAKPTVCALFPIGRAMKTDAAQQALPNAAANQTLYIFTAPGCGDTAETHTVREWLEAFGIPIEDQFFIEWSKTLVSLGLFFQKAEKSNSPEVMEQAWTATMIGLYLDYDTGEEFLPQFEENVKKIMSVLLRAIKEKEGEAH